MWIGSKSIAVRLVFMQKSEGIYRVTHDLEPLETYTVIRKIVAVLINFHSKPWHVILQIIYVSVWLLFNSNKIKSFLELLNF